MTDTLRRAESVPKAAKTAAPWTKLAIETGPLLLFFFANWWPKLFEPFVAPFLSRALLEGKSGGLFTATAVLMVAVVVALVVSYLRTRRIPTMPMVTAVFVLVFGALTFHFQDDRFIKMKPTFLYTCFGLALFGGLAFGKPLLSIALDNAMSLTERGWRLLTVRWAVFFLALAVLNEIVWRTQSNEVWATFKFPGTAVLIFLFTFTQVPLIMKHEDKSDSSD
jgi:intracellular septation protein